MITADLRPVAAAMPVSSVVNPPAVINTFSVTGNQSASLMKEE